MRIGLVDLSKTEMRHGIRRPTHRRDMTRSLQHRIAAATVIGLLLMIGCAEDRMPTEVDVERQTPSAPSSPAPPPQTPQTPAPNGDNRRSFVWKEDGGFTILPNPPGVLLVGANAINNKGEVAGTLIMDASAGAPIYRGFKWSAARGFTYIVGPDVVNVHVKGIDDEGNVVGYTEWYSDRYAFVWNEAEGLRWLGIRTPFLNVLGIRAGIVFGNAVDRSTVIAFRLPRAGGPLEMFRTSSEMGGGLMDTNSRAEAVGYDGNINHGFGGSSDAVIWDEAGNPTLAYDCKAEDDCFASLIAINSSGLAVGQVTNSRFPTRVFKWSRSEGVSYFEVPKAGFEISVTGVNDEGTILARNGREGFLFKASGKVVVIGYPETLRLVQPRAMNRDGHVVGMLF